HGRAALFPRPFSRSSVFTIMTTKHDETRSEVRKAYAAAACGGGCGCGGTPESSLALGYSPEDLAAVPEGANLGLGCGNPQAIAAIQEGETVLDLGSGAGFDCFLAAKRVGAKGDRKS